MKKSRGGIKLLADTENYIAASKLAKDLGISMEYIKKMVYTDETISKNDVRIMRGLYVKKSIVQSIKDRLKKVKRVVDK